MNDKITLYEKNANENLNKIKELEKEITIKDYELNKLQLKLNNYGSIYTVKPGERVIAVNFISQNQDIKFPMACKNTDIIARLEEKLYNEYPEYKEHSTYLTVNGNLIKRFKN